MARTRVEMPAKVIGDALKKSAAKFSGFKPAREVFLPITAVQTRFIQFDHATRVGGMPLKRAVLVHGPSNQGKTTYVLGVTASYLDAGGTAFYIDAERTLDDKYTATIMGKDRYESDLFIGYKPDSYESAIDSVRKWAMQVVELRESGGLPADAPGLIIVDSLRKMTPKNLAKNVASNVGAEGKGADGAGGRAGMIRAGINAAWLDELIPLIDTCNLTVLFIVRESENPDKKNQYDLSYKLTGGKAIYYDASLVVRIERDGYIGPKTDKAQIVYGERHRGTITKTKIGGKDGKTTRFYFSTSNGLLDPTYLGLEPQRDVFDVAKRLKMIEVSGSWLSCPELDLRTQGEHSFIAELHDQPEKFKTLAGMVRAKLNSEEPEEFDEEPEKVEEGDEFEKLIGSDE